MTEIKDRADALCEQIREFSKSQKDIWQQIPWWANQANGRTGWSDNYTRAVESGYYATYSENGYYRVYIDLENGRLVSPHNTEQEVNNTAVLRFAYQMNYLDAAKLLAELKEDITKPYGSYYSAQAITEAEVHRQENIEKYELTPLAYKRKFAYKPYYGID
jgi:hypothetical protein